MQSKRLVIAIGCGALFSVPFFLQGAALSRADEQFIKIAAEDNMTEAHLGQMAEAQAAGQQVKDFGQTLSKDHTSAYEKLSVIANKTGTPIPKAIGHDRTIERLMHLKGSSFDHAFIQDEVQSHKMAIAAFKREAEHGEDADVKAYAQATIPTLEQHLQMAEKLEKQKK